MEFRKFDRPSLAATLDKWKDEAEKHDFFPDEIERRLAWVGDALDAAESQSRNTQHVVIPYGVFCSDSGVAAATCELVLTDRGSLTGKWLKMLKVTLSPEIEALIEEDDFNAITTAVQAYSTATIGSFDARLEHDADTLKLFGRNTELQRFQMTLMTFIQKDDAYSSIVASKEGRWLVLKSAN